MKQVIMRSILYLSGLYLTALGIVITTQCDLGVASLTCLATSLSMVSQATLGTVLAILYCVFVGIEYLILRKDFQRRQLLQMFFAFLFGFFTDTIALFLHLSPTSFPERFLWLWVGLVVCALGVVITIQMDLVPCAPDGLVQVIAKQFHKPFGHIKVRFDTICVLLGIGIAFLFTHSLGGFGLTTLLSALFLGRIMHGIEWLLQQKLKQIAFGG